MADVRWSPHIALCNIQVAVAIRGRKADWHGAIPCQPRDPHKDPERRSPRENKAAPRSSPKAQRRNSGGPEIKSSSQDENKPRERQRKQEDQRGRKATENPKGRRLSGTQDRPNQALQASAGTAVLGDFGMPFPRRLNAGVRLLGR